MKRTTFITIMFVLLQAIVSSYALAEGDNRDTKLEPVVTIETDTMKATDPGTGETFTGKLIIHNIIPGTKNVIKVVKNLLRKAGEQVKFIHAFPERYASEKGRATKIFGLVSRALNRENDNFRTAEIYEMPVPDEVIEKEKKILDYTSREGKKNIILSVVKTVINGSVSGVALVASFGMGLPVLTAAPVFLYVALFSGVMQLFMPKLQTFLTGTKDYKEKVINSGKYGIVNYKVISLSKAFLTNSIYYVYLNNISMAFGAQPASGSLLLDLVRPIQSALISTLSCGLLTTAIADRRLEQMKFAKTKKAGRSIQWKANASAFAVGMVGTFGGTLVQFGNSSGYFVMAGLASVGAYYTIKSMTISPLVRPITFSPRKVGGRNCRTVFAF